MWVASKLKWCKLVTLCTKTRDSPLETILPFRCSNSKLITLDWIKINQCITWVKVNRWKPNNNTVETWHIIKIVNKITIIIDMMAMLQSTNHFKIDHTRVKATRITMSIDTTIGNILILTLTSLSIIFLTSIPKALIIFTVNLKMEWFLSGTMTKIS